MRRLLHAIVLGLIGAGIVHAAIIILMPHFGERDLLTRLSAVTVPDRFAPLSDNLMAQAGLQPTDPAIRLAACRFSIADSPVRLTAEGTVPFWSVSIFDARGVNLYSINDRSADPEVMDVLVATPLQLIELKKVSPADIADAIVFENEMDEGFAVLRVLRHTDSWSDLVDSFLASADCGPYAVPEDTPGVPVPVERPENEPQTN